jgi:hypothetical protein
MRPVRLRNASLAMTYAVRVSLKNRSSQTVWRGAHNGLEVFWLDACTDEAQMNHDLAGHRLYAIVRPKRRSR